MRLDLNNSAFQKEWFVLQKDDFNATKNTLKRLSLMTWDQVYNDRGLRWEKIQSIKTEK